MSAADEIEAALTAVGADWRRVADGEWGLSVEAADWPLHIGIAVRDGLVRIQAEVCEPGLLDAHELLHRNRLLALARFAHTRAGAVWLHADLPAATVDAAQLDGALARLVSAAQDARYAASALRRARSR
jgi:hypothetical protein